VEIDKEYTIEQIKKAFWEEFHKSGELWFEDIGTEEESAESTDGYWRDFKEYLEKE
jgi:hypothetical protein